MVSIRLLASDEEMIRCADLAREIWQEHYTAIIGSDQVAYMLEKFQSPAAIRDQIFHGYEYYLVGSEGVAVGYFALAPDERPTALMLSKIYVHKRARGNGFGKAALRFAEDLCRARGVERLWLTVNKHNRRSVSWYKHMGFVCIGAVVQDIGSGFVMDDFRMEKRVRDDGQEEPSNPGECVS